jgi:HAD superfamily hydrolase (TIGR01459 family)
LSTDELLLPDPIWCAGLAPIADRYDGFAVDQWGVLHDGRTAYPGAVDCLTRLRAMGKCVVILSNSGKRAHANTARLAAMGFPPETYSALITSGEVVWRALAKRADAFYRSLGDRCLLFSNDGDRSVVEGLGLTLVEDPRDASFILLAGVDDRTSPEQIAAAFEWGSRHAVPMLCANPDRTRIAGDKLMPSCGAVAHEYERMGGRVHFVGKPHPDIYRACGVVFEGAGAGRVAAVGDSVQHDVVGGEEAGYDTVFVLNGIHRQEFAGADAAARLQRVRALGHHYGALPDWMIDDLRW